MKQGPLRILGALVLAAGCTSIAASTAAAQMKLVSGKLTGVVRDTTGIPQMGASVEVIPEMVGGKDPLQFLTNTQGIFRGDRIPTGLYTIRVTLAGFLPTLQQHVRINANLTTMVRVQLESLFASLEQLRRSPSSAASETDDWKWVLRSAAGMRPILQWDEDDLRTVLASSVDAGQAQPRMILQFTDGARRPGSVSNVAAAPGTAFAYEQRMGGTGRLMIAGQMSYEDGASGGVATVWMPTGTLGAGPHTALVLREAKLGPDGLMFRGVRIDQGGAVALGERTVLHYGGEYVLVGLGTSASSVRPRLKVESRLSDEWSAAAIFASQPAEPNSFDGADDGESGLYAAIDALDSFPALMWRDGHPVLQGGWHEEVSVERKLGTRGKLQAAVFHDDNHHVAVFGRGRNLPIADFFPDAFSSGFAYDGGSGSGWGGRLALREKLGNDVELTAVYSVSGALAPGDTAEGPLRDSLRMAARHSLGANVSAKVPRLGTKVLTGYKWIDGPAVSRVDSYGESLYQMDPFLHVAVRQQLPKFGPGHWEAMADCENLLAQGYVTLNTRDGQVVLVPAFRTFRGGLSVQF